MVLRFSLIFCTTIGKYSQKWYLLFFKERQYPVIKNIGGCNSVLALIEFGKCHPAVGINESLLINTANSFDITHIVCILGTQIAWMFGFYFAESFSFFLLTFHSNYLRLSQNNTILRNTVFQGL